MANRLVPTRGFEFLNNYVIPVRRNVLQRIPRTKRDLTSSDKDRVKEYLSRPRFLRPLYCSDVASDAWRLNVHMLCHLLLDYCLM